MDFVTMMDDADPIEDSYVTLDVPSKPRVPRARTRIDPFTHYSDDEFKLRYRFQKETVGVLIDLMDEKLGRPTRRSNALSTDTQVFLALRYAASGDFLRTDADLHGVAPCTVSACIHRVFETIAALKPSFIKFPEPEEYPVIERAYYEMRGVPGVLGAVDGTHIPILNPGTEDCERYRNRKGWMSINTQIMCDNKLSIRNIVSTWPGGSHDSRIFNESSLKTQLEHLPRRYHILGDRGYTCEPYLLTPVPCPDERAEKRFNFAQSSTRMIIERLTGILKRRFPCLEHKLRFSPEKCAVIIVACAVLHNLGIMENDPWEEDTEPLDIPTDNGDTGGDKPEGSVKRAAIIREYFGQ